MLAQRVGSVAGVYAPALVERVRFPRRKLPDRQSVAGVYAPALVERSYPPRHIRNQRTGLRGSQTGKTMRIGLMKISVIRVTPPLVKICPLRR